MERDLTLPDGPVLRRARVVGPTRDAWIVELEILEGPMTGETVPGGLYSGATMQHGDTVLANTVGLEMGLGTGGVAIVMPGPGGDAPVNRDHFVKLPYTPLQFPVPPPPQADSLSGIPIVVLPLHSHLAPACCAAADIKPGCRVSFVWQEGGALPVAFSRTLPTLREKGLLHSVVSAGNCFGGDVEAPNIYSGLLAAALDADLVLAGIGPGVAGTGTGYGHGGMSAAVALNAARALGGSPVLAPRVSTADSRDRHSGLSHHTRSVLSATLASCRVAFPEDYSEDASTEGLPELHDYRRVSRTAAGLQERFGVTFESMGRSYEKDPVFFDAAAAAVALALTPHEVGAG